MDFNHILANRRRELKLTQPEVARLLSARIKPLTHKAVSKWEQGMTHPDAEQFIYLCEIYDIRDVLSLFLGREPQSGNVMDGLNALGRARLLEYAAMLRSTDKYRAKPQTKKQRDRGRTMMLYDLPASAGAGVFLDNDNYELIDVDDDVPSSATFAVRISGESMTPQYVNNQIVYVKQQQTLENGDFGIFLLNGDAFCKRLSLGAQTELVSVNDDYKPIRVAPDDELRIIGKVVG